jgi:hypothetical protein
MGNYFHPPRAILALPKFDREIGAGTPPSESRHRKLPQQVTCSSCLGRMKEKLARLAHPKKDSILFADGLTIYAMIQFNVD